MSAMAVLELPLNDNADCGMEGRAAEAGDRDGSGDVGTGPATSSEMHLPVDDGAGVGGGLSPAGEKALDNDGVCMEDAGANAPVVGHDGCDPLSCGGGEPSVAVELESAQVGMTMVDEEDDVLVVHERVAS